MAHSTDTRCLVQYYGLPLLAVIAVGTGLTASCIHANEDHCAISGGDFGCANLQICILERTEGVESPADGYGCHTFDESEIRADLDLSDVPNEMMVRVPYGLPKRFEFSFDGDLDSVEGVVNAAADEQGLDITGCDLEELRPTWSKLSEFVRNHIDRKGRVRISGIVLDANRIGWIEAFNRKVRNLLSAECVTMLQDTETGDTESDSNGTGSGGTGSGGTDDSTTGSPVPCGQDNGECPESMPFCDPVTEQCVQCDDMPDSDAACAGVDANNPLCFEGSCVACTDGNTSACNAQGYVCDIDTMACVPCAEHAKCPSGACDLMLGTPTCFPEYNVLNVGANQPNTTIKDALNVAALSRFNRVVLRLHESEVLMIDFDQSVVISGSGPSAAMEAIAFIAAEGDTPLWSLPAKAGMSAPMLNVNKEDIRVYVDGVSLSESTSQVSTGFVCSNGAIDIRRSRIIQNTAGGILVNDGCTLHIQNSFVGSNNSNADAITINSLVGNSSTLNLLYTTVVAKGGNSALACGTKSVATIRNSIMVVTGNNDAINCSSATIENSATNEKIDDSTPVGNWDMEWFTAPGDADFSLANQGQIDFADIAIWQPGDPTTDIHGDPRPAMDGTDYPGADIP